MKITNHQMATLCYLISRSGDISENGKKILQLMLVKSKNLTKPVCVSIGQEQFGEVANEFGYGVHDMLSANGTTHMHRWFDLLGIKFGFSSHCGRFVDGDLDHSVSGYYTCWLSTDSYDKKAELIPIEMSDIENIKLFDWKDVSQFRDDEPRMVNLFELKHIIARKLEKEGA